MKKVTRVFGITIITAVGLAACGQTNDMEHKNHESTKEKKTEQKEMKMNQEVTAPKEMNKGASNDLLTTSLKKWTPDDLKNISYIPKKKAISKFEVFGGLMWTAIWATLYFYANHLVGVYNGTENGLKFIAPTFNQDVLLQYWPIILVMIVFEVAISLYKLVQGQWTKRLAIGNGILQVVGTIVFIVIVVNPHIFNEGFITYLANVFTISPEGFKTWLVGGGIIIYTLSAAINIFDGFRKASIRMWK